MDMGQFFPSGYGYGFVCPLGTLPTAIPCTRSLVPLTLYQLLLIMLLCTDLACLTLPLSSTVKFELHIPFHIHEIFQVVRVVYALCVGLS
jgi:hypothetical protein